MLKNKNKKHYFNVFFNKKYSISLYQIHTNFLLLLFLLQGKSWGGSVFLQSQVKIIFTF